MCNSVSKKWSKHKVFVDLSGFFDKHLRKIKRRPRQHPTTESSLNHKREENRNGY
jgi:hypothetical protein